MGLMTPFAAGQERFRTLTSSYYRGAQGIVLDDAKESVKKGIRLRLLLMKVEFSTGCRKTWLLVKVVAQKLSPRCLHLHVGGGEVCLTNWLQHIKKISRENIISARSPIG
ncbi:uncharacterized protein [Coffea arabica]|uniref:Uncharacterized protein n=1 Tax=Coffea arabica TaxID=13443 RepID=A0ABM4V2V7_COFAR